MLEQWLIVQKNTVQTSSATQENVLLKASKKCLFYINTRKTMTVKNNSVKQFWEDELKLKYLTNKDV